MKKHRKKKPSNPFEHMIDEMSPVIHKFHHEEDPEPIDYWKLLPAEDQERIRQELKQPLTK